MSGTGDDKVSLAAVQVSLDFRQPFAISTSEKAFREGGKVAELLHHDPRFGIGISASSRPDHLITRATMAALRRQKYHQQHCLTLTIS